MNLLFNYLKLIRLYVNSAQMTLLKNHPHNGTDFNPRYHLCTCHTEEVDSMSVWQNIKVRPSYPCGTPLQASIV